jgi:hypothetical protein
VASTNSCVNLKLVSIGLDDCAGSGRKGIAVIQLSQPRLYSGVSHKLSRIVILIP